MRRTDKNQADIMRALMRVGASVHDLSAAGHGCPDLLVGFRGVNYLLEIKSEKGKLNETQQRWHAAWQGQVAVVRTVDEALTAIGARGVAMRGLAALLPDAAAKM